MRSFCELAKMSEALFESAQAILAGCDTAMSQRWREEDRQWRKEDLQWRKQEEHLLESELDFMYSFAELL